LRQGGKGYVRQALLEVREQTLAWADAYADALSAREMRIPYAPEVNPPLWELAHVAWFQEWWVGRNRERSLGAQCEPTHDRLPSRLAQADDWYDSSRVEHQSRWELPLPGLQASLGYLADTFAQTLELLDALPATASADDLYFFRLVALHEAMHGEAAIYMARPLGVQLPSMTRPRFSKIGAVASLKAPAQTLWLGSPAGGFAFDNELQTHEVALDAFEIDAEPVSWERFMAFVDAGGLQPKPQWRAAAALDPSGPAQHLNAYEAQAWCHWAGRRLPSEAEWECAATTVPGFAWGRVWEWTATPFQPYPGFVPHPYRDYSQPWFGTRRVLRGACDATSPWLAHPRYRNFFEPQRSDIFAGFRSCA
jgi:iron(II)-dependent oxidoreductase